MNKTTMFSKYYKNVESYILSRDLKKVYRNVAILAVLIGLIGGYLWFSRMYMTNERRFWLAINNSMSTQSVTRTLSNGGTGNKVIQDQQFFFSPQVASRSHVFFTQKSATVDTTVETEGVAFPDSQYSRYTSFNTNQLKDDGTEPSLDDVLGKWEGTVVEEAELETAKQSYVSELVTLAVFGNFDANYRNEVINRFRSTDTYKITENGIVEDVIDGRNVIIVPVSVGLRGFATELQNAFKKAGYGEFAPLAPENYQEGNRINAQFVIDKKNNSIIAIQYGNRDENYSGYGINKQIVKPDTEYSTGELEAIVQEEIQSAL